jgi:hypothetical protein
LRKNERLVGVTRESRSSRTRIHGADARARSNTARMLYSSGIGV